MKFPCLQTVVRARVIRNFVGTRMAALFLRHSGFTLEQALRALGMPVRSELLK